MKKILFLMPLTATLLLVNCGGGGDEPTPPTPPAPPTYSIDVNSFGCTVDGLKKKYDSGEDAILKFTAEENFTLSNDLKVKIGKTVLTKDTDYTYNLNETSTVADFKIKVTNDISVMIVAACADAPLTFTCNKDNSSFGVYHFAAEAPSNETTNLEYVVKDTSGAMVEQGKVTLTDSDIGPKMLLDKKLQKDYTIELYGNNPSGFNQTKLEIHDEGEIVLKKIAATSFITGNEDDFSVSGNIMSLINKNNFSTLDSVPGIGCFEFLFMSDEVEEPGPFSISDEEEKYFCNISDASGLYIPCVGFFSHAGLFTNCKTLVKAPTSLPALYLAISCYTGMFMGCKSLVVAPKLPSTNLAISCYERMFDSCSSLEQAPSLSAITLAYSCYASMFNNCTSLTAAPELPATELAEECYDHMFYFCTSLVTPPTMINATELKTKCCSHMFDYCTSLTTTPLLPTTKLAPYCYEYMFQSCIKLTKASRLPATKLEEGSYYHMFNTCRSLIKAPTIDATTLDIYCCESMFGSCTSLTTPPVLKAEKLADLCYYCMFEDCTNLIVKKTPTGAKSFLIFKCPKLGPVEEYHHEVFNMFLGTKGDFGASYAEPKEGDYCYCCYEE